MEKVTALIQDYYDKILAWYGNLTFLEQMGVLFVLIVIAFGVVAYILIKRAAGT
ncbi:MAG TPA: hypothetical protein PLT64_05485 [Syntrophales bacterium]|nr:hypothetical protein [Syntrophales bacterium]HOL59304.1 hypothetical protein [Syntrophales bacterium]HPO35503.1 hypothetical protein [Syntrophales bacterium]